MSTFKWFLFALALVIMPGFMQAQTIPGTWTQTLNEEFNGTSLDTSIWNYGYRWGPIINNERQYYWEENVEVSGGICRFKMEKKSDTRGGYTQQYASGAIASHYKWAQTYGLFEARIKMPTATGLWPAFWLMPDRGAAYPDSQRWTVNVNNVGVDGCGTEFDVMEYLTHWGDYYHTAIHWGYSAPGVATGAGGAGVASHLVPDITEYHVYSLYWEPGRCIFFVDGIETQRYEDADTVGNVPHYLLLNCAMGGSWPEGEGAYINDAELPDYMHIDWVKVYSGTADPSVLDSGYADEIVSMQAPDSIPVDDELEVTVNWSASTQRKIRVAIWDQNWSHITGSSIIVQAGTGTNTFTIDTSGLISGNLYHIDAAVQENIQWGSLLDLAYKFSVPAVTPDRIVSFTAPSVLPIAAQVPFEVTWSAFTQRRVRVAIWNQSWGHVTGNYIVVPEGSGTDTINVDTSMLVAGQTYHIDVAVREDETWGALLDVAYQFSTPAALPVDEILTLDAPDIIPANGTFTVDVTWSASETRKIRVGVWSTSWANVAGNYIVVQPGAGTSTITVTTSGLTPGATYHIDAGVQENIQWGANLDLMYKFGVTAQ